MPEAKKRAKALERVCKKMLFHCANNPLPNDEGIEDAQTYAQKLLTGNYIYAAAHALDDAQAKNTQSTPVTVHTICVPQQIARIYEQAKQPQAIKPQTEFNLYDTLYQQVGNCLQKDHANVQSWNPETQKYQTIDWQQLMKSTLEGGAQTSVQNENQKVLLYTHPSQLGVLLYTQIDGKCYPLHTESGSALFLNWAQLLPDFNVREMLKNPLEEDTAAE